jgi:hypothetical protein
MGALPPEPTPSWREHEFHQPSAAIFAAMDGFGDVGPKEQSTEYREYRDDEDDGHGNISMIAAHIMEAHRGFILIRVKNPRRRDGFSFP